MPNIEVSHFVQRQTAASRFSHYTGSWEEVRKLATDCFDQAKPGYREGVLLVPVPAEGFLSGVVTLKEGDTLQGSFEARQDGEEPRKNVQTKGEKQPAKHVDIVLYHADVLDENNERSSDAEWEIISINARITDEEMPMHPSTLMYNHFEMSGGTATEMSDGEFVSALHKSFAYWRDKSFVEGVE